MDLNLQIPTMSFPWNEKQEVPSHGSSADAHGQRVAVRNEHTGISDVPSTFVHAPPGGRSNLCLGGYGGDAPAESRSPAPRAAPPAAHDGAFGARVAVQTEHTGISDRPSTLVHAPPGGASSLNLFA